MTQVPEQLVLRFQSLDAQRKSICLLSDGEDSIHADPEEFYAWVSSAMHAIQAAFGRDSAHYQSFQAEISAIQNNYIWERKFRAISGIFSGAKADVDGGHLFDLERSVTGEIFGDFVSAAKAALDEGNHTVAAVLACAALEDALKRYAQANGLRVDGETMDSVVNALKSKGLVSGAQKSLLTTMPKIRNFAMHADWTKITPQDAGSVIGFVEQFLLSNFN